LGGSRSKKKPANVAGFPFPTCYLPKTYWLAPDAGAAIEALASDAGAIAAEAAESLAAAAPDAAAEADEAAAEASEAAAEAEAAASLAGADAWSLLLLHAANAMAASREATRRDFFMITSFYG
jgi:hypothetical protein